ncbi:MAG: GHMP kinase [Verrucomicrobiales bacterium]|nr:GHMP kinase [Verrucomicrobiales bacterium]
MPQTIRVESHARAGLMGNPSDGYFGKTISLIVRNFLARVELTESKDVHIVPSPRDICQFDTLEQLADSARLFGYHGGVRLLKAAATVFFEHCRQHDIPLAKCGFTIRYMSTVPERVGMAGSSAIVTACLRALMKFYSVDIPEPILPNLTLSVERDELGIPAGLQDRVIQAYGGCVFMDFDRTLMERQGHGQYERIDPALLPPLYVAYNPNLGEGTEVFHNDIKSRWLRGDPEVVDAMHQWAALAQHARDLIVAGRGREIAPLVNANFDLRCRIYRIGQGNIDMVETARKTGASAKFTGSGGAIIGTCEDDAMYQRLEAEMKRKGFCILKPEIV